MAMADILDQKSSPEARGKRLKSLRMMAGLSRKKLQTKHRLSASTTQSWEDAKAGGLTRKGAQKTIKVFRQEGIRCTVDWLLYGIGLPPQLSDKLFQQQLNKEAIEPLIEITEERAIVNELLAFRQHNPDAIEFINPDDGMLPFYHKGDYVAGKRRYNEVIDSVLGRDCIIETKDNEVLLRRLKLGSQPGFYTLLCLNPDAADIAEFALHDQEILSAAPVIWVRRKDP
jgi:hypothetical protein